MMDISVSFSIPYHPQSKNIERFFDTLDQRFTKTFATYCGKDSARKPENLNDQLKKQSVIDEAPSLEEFESMLAEFVEAYNNTKHTGEGMDNQTPNQVISQRTSRRVLAEGVLNLIAGVWSGELTVGKNGVRFKGMWYGQYDTALLMYQGKKVRVKYDPDAIERVWVYEASTMRLVCEAEQASLVRYGAAVNEEALREASRKKAKAYKVVKQAAGAQLIRNSDLTTLALKAMTEAAEPVPEKTHPAIKPVSTPLDGQVKEHARRKNVRVVKKAAGAENVNEVADFAIDWDSINDDEPIGKLDFDVDSLVEEKRKQQVKKLRIFEDD